MNKKLEKYSPNTLFENNSVSIGEFKTLEDAVSYPLSVHWSLDRKYNNPFENHKQQGYRVLIICSWKRDDEQRFVLAYVKGNTVSYFDMNDIPLDTIRNEYEESIDKDAVEIIHNLS